MRTSIALIACCFVIATAYAADPPPAGMSKPIPVIRPPTPNAAPASSASASASSASSASSSASAASSSPMIKGRAPVLSERQREDQAARVAQQAKVKKAAAVAAVVAAAPVIRHGTHWAYEGEDGPANWANVNVDWAKCGNGKRQSPIDIRDGMKVDLEQITFDYHPSSFNVTDNGHTVQVQVGGGNFITVQDRMYELTEFHFHRPSEERINGRGYEMVVHLVHRDGEGHIAILALLIERGKPQSAIQTVWNNLPLEKFDTAAPAIVLDPNDLLPQRREYFTFMGSLTTPPCTEGVLWLVMKEPIQASPAQMALFSRLYPYNARPTQPSSGRIIKESN